MNNNRFIISDYIESYFIKLLSTNPNDDKNTTQFKYNQSVIIFNILEEKRQEFMKYYTGEYYNFINTTKFMGYDNNFSIQLNDDYIKIGLKFDKLIDLIKIIFNKQHELFLRLI